MTGLLCALALATAVALVRGTSPRRRLPHAPRNETRPHRLQSNRSLRRQREAEVVDAVFALAAELRAGRAPGQALSLVASCTTHLREDLSVAASAVEAGASASSELGQVAQTPGCSGFAAVAAAWQVTESAGGAVADVLERLGDTLDIERQNRAALNAALAAPRATMVLLAALPILGLALGQSFGARPISVLVHRPLGWAMLALGTSLDAIGIAWTRALVRRALR